MDLPWGRVVCHVAALAQSVIKCNPQWMAPLSRISGFPLRKGRQTCTTVGWDQIAGQARKKLD